MSPTGAAEVQANLSLRRRDLPSAATRADRVAGSAAHGTRLQRTGRAIADLGRRFSLTNPSRIVRPHAALTRSMTSGFNGSPRPPPRAAPPAAAQILLNEHAATRSAEHRTSYAAADQFDRECGGVEALKLIGEHVASHSTARRSMTRRAWPTGRTQVEVHVAAPQSNPIRRRQVPDE